MDWSGHEAFAALPFKPFVVDKVEVGELKSHGPVSFLKVVP